MYVDEFANIRFQKVEYDIENTITSMGLFFDFLLKSIVTYDHKEHGSGISFAT